MCAFVTLNKKITYLLTLHKIQQICVTVTLTDETGYRFQFGRQFVQPVRPHLILQQTTLKKPRKVLQFLNDHET